MTQKFEVQQCPSTFAVTSYQPYGDHHSNISAHDDSNTTRPVPSTHQQAVQTLSQTFMWTRRSSGDYGRMSTISHRTDDLGVNTTAATPRLTQDPGSRQSTISSACNHLSCQHLPFAVFLCVTTFRVLSLFTIKRVISNLLFSITDTDLLMFSEKIMSYQCKSRNI